MKKTPVPTLVSTNIYLSQNSVPHRHEAFHVPHNRDMSLTHCPFCGNDYDFCHISFFEMFDLIKENVWNFFCAKTVCICDLQHILTYSVNDVSKIIGGHENQFLPVCGCSDYFCHVLIFEMLHLIKWNILCVKNKFCFNFSWLNGKICWECVTDVTCDMNKMANNVHICAK